MSSFRIDLASRFSGFRKFFLEGVCLFHNHQLLRQEQVGDIPDFGIRLCGSHLEELTVGPRHDALLAAYSGDRLIRVPEGDEVVVTDLDFGTDCDCHVQDNTSPWVSLQHTLRSAPCVPVVVLALVDLLTGAANADVLSLGCCVLIHTNLSKHMAVFA